MRNKKIPSTRELRLFGFLAGGIVATLFGAFLPWMKGGPTPLWPFLAASAVWIVALAAPRGLGWIHRALTGLAAILTRLLSYAALAVIFYVIVVTLGFLTRLLGRDPLALDWDAKSPSCRVQSKPAGSERPNKSF
jgi:hypothetical protein